MYPILKVNQEKEESISSYRLVGSSNDTLDQYQLNSAGVPGTISCQKLLEGDKIIFLQAGAYSLSFTCNYCLEGNPKVIFLEKK
jgi:diaminopimelate decarboxylase